MAQVSPNDEMVNKIYDRMVDKLNFYKKQPMHKRATSIGIMPTKAAKEAREVLGSNSVERVINSFNLQYNDSPAYLAAKERFLNDYASSAGCCQVMKEGGMVLETRKYKPAVYKFKIF